MTQDVAKITCQSNMSERFKENRNLKKYVDKLIKKQSLYGQAKAFVIINDRAKLEVQRS